MATAACTSVFVKLMARYELTEEDCKGEVSDTDIVKIASSLRGKWESKLPPLLEMETTDIGTPVEDKIAFFEEWKQQQGFDATYKSLISALLQVKCRQDAESVCKILKETTLSQASTSTNTTSIPSSSVSEAPGMAPQNQASTIKL